MKTLSVKQPYAYLLCAGIKDVENRTWKLPEKLKGERVLIHASSKIANRDELLLENYKALEKIIKSDSLNTETSAIIGSVRFTDCIQNSNSIWALKDNYHWIVEDAVLFDRPIMNVKGKLNFWEYEQAEIITRLCNE